MYNRQPNERLANRIQEKALRALNGAVRPAQSAWFSTNEAVTADRER